MCRVGKNQEWRPARRGRWSEPRQNLAGNACVTFSMIGDLERAARRDGDRGYRYAHFEAGAIGHRLYLAAEALGVGATGIGAFYDDEVHRHLNLVPNQGQVVYHFAIGYPVPDPRLAIK
jgi:nitroreductase